MTINELLGQWTHGLRIERQDRAITAIFEQPHTVLGSAMFHSGMRPDLVGVMNMQTSEATGNSYHPTIMQIKADAAQLAQRFHLEPTQVMTMGTAASMRCYGLAERWYEDDRCPPVGVIAVATAGVEGNAGRAGDPTTWVELDGDYWPRPDSATMSAHHRTSPTTDDCPPSQGSGTINIMVFLSAPLKPTAFGRAIITATEAKSAVLTEFAVGSLYSPTPATGTGTDQIIISAPTEGPHFISGVGHHVVMGEMLGQVVMAAVRDALRQQNGMTPMSRCSVLAQLSRFGLNQERFITEAAPYLPDHLLRHLEENVHAMIHDQVVVGLSAALATVADQVRTGILSHSAGKELAARLGTQIAMAVCTDRADGTDIAATMTKIGLDPAVLVPTAVALGWEQRWDWEQAKRIDRT
ncbi:adenosylcobinamide amidohydrolase [Stomatohabitans albus]|uniref:adenosylcobinamide amidohydrolase n=1 Tax=Stomatohabitans albus TaxID=3110766 RepID=UPI00300C89E9